MFDGLRFRHWQPEARADGILVLTLERADAPVNALSQEVLEELDNIIERLEIDSPKAVVIRSGKAAGFIAGADLKEFQEFDARGTVMDAIRRGQLVFERLNRLSCPTVVAIHGHCMGGGTELSLACRYRVASSDDSTRIGLPEVKLGIFPGWGGSVRLPHLVGTPAAMDMMLTGRALSAKNARAIGLVDKVVEPAVLLDAAIEMAKPGTTRPLKQMSAAAKRFAVGDFESRVYVKTKDEIGELAAAFNEMADFLASSEGMRRNFIANVSHELKTPIALIQGYAEGLKEGVSDDPESRAFYCDVIMDEANKMNQLVKNLLTLNQLEFGEEEIAFERFDITELIRGIIQSNEILIQQKEAEVRFVCQEPIFVWADEFRVEQVVRNYLSNALNHVENEKIIDIRITKMDGNDKIRVSVFNTGKQIPNEEIEHIWSKFYNVEKARTREYGGHGIGLSIVKAIMDSFQQDYGVVNYENGVAFWFELDLK